MSDTAKRNRRAGANYPPRIRLHSHVAVCELYDWMVLM